MNLKNLGKIAILSIASTVALSASAQGVTLNVNVGDRGPVIGDRHYGIFFEEINHAGEGGLYAELVKNRSFEAKTSSEGWTATGTASSKVVTDGLLNNVQRHALQVTFGKEGDGVKNSGYWGMNMVKDRTYTLSFWMKAGSYTGSITAVLQTAGASDIGSAKVSKVKDGANGWAKYEATITATGNDAKGALALRADKAGVVTIDEVSLFPPTFKDRANGCRPDLAQMLADMKPKFMRFPGGCYVEGGERFEWKKTIGPIEERPGHQCHWNYWVTDGFGFHEMLQLGEDLGAEPLFVVNIGMGHGWTVDYNNIGEYIQEALDAIEYCNGDESTTWGAKRIANGHPEPFNLRLLEIGNENYQANASEQSDHYAERYKQFHDAIRAKYPEMVLIGNVESWGTDNPTWRNSNPVDVLDEHYYRNPDWFVNSYSKYDSYDRTGAKIYAGEYAVTSNFGTNGHLTAALGEAVYMLGMENNSDMVVMNSYAPIFVNENDQTWKPDMIRFNSSECLGTPSYYVQKLMANYVGKQNVRWTEEGNLGAANNKMGLSTWSTAATFDNVKITDANGNTLFADDFSSSNPAWTAPSAGTWSVANGVLTQSSESMQGAIYANSTVLGDSYTIELDATKNSGQEGFLIAFNYRDAQNYCWWNLGGWNNANHAIEVCTNGTKTSYGKVSGSLQNGHTYKVKIVVAGTAVKCYLDGELIHDITLPASRSVYVASAIDEPAKTLYIKIVNPGSASVPTTINVACADMLSCAATVLTSANGTDENNMSNPTKVAPTESEPAIESAKKMIYTAPAYSLSILRIAVDNIVTMEAEEATEEEIAAVKDELASTMTKFNFLHATTALPSGTKSGAAINWTLTQKQAGHVDLGESGLSQSLAVAKQPAALTNVATLHANVKFPNNHEAVIDYDVFVAPKDEEAGYLYCFMNSSTEITNFALGTKEDAGLKFDVLLGGAEVFNTAELAGIEGGTRDAFMARGQRADEYFMTTTDMKQHASGVWSNYGIDLLRSTDMIHWESSVFDFRKGKSIFSDPDATDVAYKTDAEYAKIYRVWAPQFIWDPEKKMYLVYYSILSSNSGDNNDKIYYSYADADFKTLTQPRLFFSKSFSVIDGDIVYNPYTKLYHLAYKWEGSNGGDRGVYIATSDKLVGGTWKDILHVTLEGNEQVEGATMVRRINEDVYNLYYMRYSGGSAYKVTQLNHATLSPTGSANLQGTGKFQHGSVMTITADEYTVLQAWSDITALLAQAKEAKKSTGTTIYDSAIAQAETALGGRSVSTLVETLPAAIEALKQAKCDYLESTLKEDGETDITSVLVNPNFANGQTGWAGTTFTAAPGTVAEHYNKTFDTYQILELMPAGIYRMEIQGFYRCGSIANAKEVHANGTEALNAEFYLNEAAKPFMSIFDSSAPYTLDPYTYPDNVTQANTAFNTNNAYHNSVVLALPERGDIKVGLRKSALVGSDWCCFDNVKLYYVSKDVEGISPVAIDANAPVDVYTPAGVLVRRAADPAAPAKGLAPGIYIAGGKKIIEK